MQLELGLGARFLICCSRNISIELFIGLVRGEKAGIGEDAWKGVKLGLIKRRCITRTVIIAVLLIARVKAIVVEITAQTLRYALLIGATTELLMLTHQALFVFILTANTILDVVTLPLLWNAATIVALELIGVTIVTSPRGVITLVRLMCIGVLTTVEKFTQLIRVGNRNGTGLQYG